jgi:hypothetical protein
VAVMGRPKMNSRACDLFKQKFKWIQIESIQR